MIRNQEAEVTLDQGNNLADPLNKRANENGVTLKNTQHQMENAQHQKQYADSAT